MPRRILAALTAVGGALLLAGGMLPAATLRGLADRLARDGSLDLLTPALVGALRGGLLLAGLGLLAAAWLLWARASAAHMFLARLAADACRFWQDLRAVRLSRWEGAGLALALAAAAYARLALIRAPIRYDEAYTFMAFAVRPAWSILSDYSLPNNHILHTLLVRAAYLAFGGELWAIRLPAFLAGLATVAAAYLAARLFYGRRAALLAAGLAAVWPYLVHYGADARGYSLVGLLTLLIFTLGAYLLERGSLLAWLLVALFSALGLFTIPVMAYPIGVLYTWLLLSALPGGRARFMRLLAGCFFSGLLTMALSGLLYAPVLIFSGPRALFANTFVRSYSLGQFFELQGVWLRGIYDSWSLGLPPLLFGLAAAGWAAVLLLQPRISRFRLNPAWAALLFFAAVLPLQRPEMVAKIFFFLVPLLLLGSAAGWAALLVRLPGPRLVQPVLLGLALAGLAWGAALQARPSLPYLLHGEMGDIEQVAIYLAGRVQPGEAVLAGYPIDPQVWYYGYRYGLAQEYFRAQEYRRAFVLVQPGMGQSLEGVLNERASAQTPLAPRDCALEIDLLDTLIYLCQAR